MTVASDLLQQHFQTLVDHNAQWQTLITDDIVWELAYAPSLGHPARLSGREAVQAARSPSSANTSIRCVRPRRSTRRFLAEDKR
jgi:hypothetical protein